MYAREERLQSWFQMGWHVINIWMASPLTLLSETFLSRQYFEWIQAKVMNWTNISFIIMFLIKNEETLSDYTIECFLPFRQIIDKR